MKVGVLATVYSVASCSHDIFHMQIDHAVTAVLQGYTYKEDKYGPLGLGDFKVGGKHFGRFIDEVCKKVAHTGRSDQVAQALRADAVLVQASQVYRRPA